MILLATAAPAAGQDEGIRACRAIVDSSARLACYDALPSAAPAPRVPPAAPVVRVPASPSATPAPQAVRPAPSGTPEAQFGLPRPRTPSEDLQAIESHIPGAFEGWGPGSLIRLANGQVWQVADDSTRRVQLRDPKVRIRRGALNSYFLDFEGDNRSPRVRRLR